MSGPKLEPQHIAAVARLHVKGRNSVEISKILASGAPDGTGGSLAPVDITPEGILWQLKNGEECQKRIRETRAAVYGAVEATPIAWAGWRAERLLELWELCRKEVANAESPSEQRKWVGEARRCLSAAKSELGDAGEALDVPEHQAVPAGGGEPPDPGEVRRRCAELLHELDGADLLDLEPAAPTTTDEE